MTFEKLTIHISLTHYSKASSTPLSDAALRLVALLFVVILALALGAVGGI
jgi:hypothetical protein